MVVVLCIAGFLGACTHTTPEHVTEQLSSTTETHIGDFLARERTHVQAQYPAKDYFIGVGHANTTQGATTVALAELTRLVRVHVTSQFTIKISEQNGITDQQIVDRIKTTTAETLQGVKHVEQGIIPETPLRYAIVAVKKDMIPTRQSIPPTQATPLRERQPKAQSTPAPIWVTVHGKALFGKDTTLANATSRAKDDARRQAIEQAVGTFVERRTRVHNSFLAEDLVTSVSRGDIIEEVWSKGGSYDDNEALYYKITLDAKVQELPPEQRSDITLRVILNRDVFEVGDEATITVTPTQDVHVYIFSITQDGTVTVLFPSRLSRDTFVKAHTPRTFPSQREMRRGITLTFQLPDTISRAIEKIKVIATTRPDDLLAAIRGSGIQEGVLNRGSGIQEGIFEEYPWQGSVLITHLYRELGLLKAKEWAEETIDYEVRK